MKKLLLSFTFAMLGYLTNAQTIEVQFYVDANNNCTYNTGEQLIYNVPYTLTYVSTSASTLAATSISAVPGCNSSTVYLSNPSVTATNTMVINALGISANLICGNYTNIPFNTNSTQYLPVTLSGTSNIGTQMTSFNYYSNTGTHTLGNVSATNNTIGICSNIGNDSIAMIINVFNYFGCNNSSSISPRTYSFYLDGVNYDQITTTGAFYSASYNVAGANAMSHLSEYYQPDQTYLYVYPELPATFTALGSHTFEIRSSMIYNNPQSVFSFTCILNSVPCTKVSGQFYNDCNSNCVFDGNDTYGVGWNATGYIYNSSGYNVTFHPNWADGKFAVYLPPNNTYMLTQYPTSTASPASYTACSNSTISIPLSATSNTFMFGYKTNSGVTIDPGVSLTRQSSSSNIISPGVTAVLAVGIFNNWQNVCNTSAINPGKIKVTLPKFITYNGLVSGATPTVITSGLLSDTLIWSVPNFTAVTNWWNVNYASFNVIVSATAAPNATFEVKATIYPTSDVNLVNNTSLWQRTIGGPFDPNGKYTEAAGLQGNGEVPHFTKQFYYTIGFQNVGNAPAINVKTLDTLDVNFDPKTLEVIQSSYPVSVQVDNVSRLVGFYFEGINLPAATTNEPKSHGFVKYGIKLKPGVANNTVLKNRAYNYFDFNAPVPTNQTSNKLVVSAAVDTYGRIENSIKAIPNPFNGTLKIVSEKGIQNIKVFNLVGELIIEAKSDSGEINLDLESLPSAIYLVRVTSTDNAISTIKVIKE